MTTREPGSASGELAAGDTATLLARAGWIQLVEEMIRGVCHDLNGSVSSFDAAAHIAERDVGNLSPEHLRDEVERTRRAVRTLELLENGTRRGSEILSPSPVVRAVSKAAALHPVLRALDIQLVSAGDPPAVRVEWSLLTRSLLLLFRDVGLRIRESGSKVLPVRLDGESELHVRIGSPGDEAPTTGPEVERSDPLARLAEEMGGCLIRLGRRWTGAALILPGA